MTRRERTEQIAKKYHVNLTSGEREQLAALLHKGRLSVRKVKRAQILLATDSGQIDEAIAQTLQAHVNMVERVRTRFEAQRILRRLDLHFTPVHASWLNMVELELAVLPANI